MNLKGFCGADPTACGYRPNGPIGPCPPGSHAQPCSSSEVMDSVSGCCFQAGPTPSDVAASPYGARIASYIYQSAAILGCSHICPRMDFLVRTAMDLAGLPAAIAVTVETSGVGPVVIEVSQDLAAQKLATYLQGK